jgi:phage host-nuclease inhibitor protein Gam
MIATAILHETKSVPAQASRRAARRRSGALASPDPGTWDEVNQRLGYLGEIDRQLRALRDDFEQKVAVLKQEWVESSRPIEKERDRVQSQIERFYWSRRDELLEQGRKSVDLAFGKLGSRISRSVVVEDVSLAQQWLEAHSLQRFLRTRTEVDREAIRSALLASSGLGDSVSHALMACPAIRFEESEQFWCTLQDVPADTVPSQTRGHWRNPAHGARPSSKSAPGYNSARDTASEKLNASEQGGSRDQAAR